MVDESGMAGWGKDFGVEHIDDNTMIQSGVSEWGYVDVGLRLTLRPGDSAAFGGGVSHLAEEVRDVEDDFNECNSEWRGMRLVRRANE